jgi:hypothetical protein
MLTPYNFLTKSNPSVSGLYIQYFEVQGQEPPPPGESYRITDDDNIRITDNGNKRITDN